MQRAHNGELRRDFYSFWLYRWFDRHGDIIYVGLTRDLYRRMKEHKRDNSKINHAVRIECVEVDCEANMEFGEKYLINKFKPRFNERCKWNGQIPDIPFYDNLNWVNIQDVIIPAAKSPIKRDYIKDYMVNHPTQIILNWKIDDMPKAFKNVLSDIINDCEQNYNISVIEA